MKKLYFSLVAVLLALVSFTANAFTVTFNFDDPDAIESVTLGKYYNTSKTDIPLEVSKCVIVESDESEGYVHIKAKQGCVLTSAICISGERSDTRFSNAFNNDYHAYVGEYTDGDVWNFTTLNLDELRTNTCTINVNGDPQKVELEVSGTLVKIPLEKGANTVKFMDMESTFSIGPKRYGDVLYQVSQNGTVVEAQNGRWSLSVAKGDVIDIETDYPDKDCTVTIGFVNPGTESCITAVTVNDETIENWQTGITCKAGDKFAFAFDSQNWNAKALYINGVEQSNFYGSYSCTVADNMNFMIEAAKYATFKATVNVDTPANLLYSIGYSYEGMTQATKATFEIEMAEQSASSTPIYFAPVDGCYFSSITANGNPVTSDPYSGNYSVYISDGMVINITTAVIARDDKFYMYFEDPSKAVDYDKYLYGYNLQRNDHKSFDQLEAGYTEFEFGVVDNPWIFTVNGSPDNVNARTFVYLNDERVEATNGTQWEMTFANNDVFKVYIRDEEPKPVLVEYIITGLVKLPVITTDYVRPAVFAEETTSHYLLPGTNVSIATAEDDKIGSVEVNGEAIEAVDGCYSFTANDDTVVKINSNITTGISDIIVSPATAVREGIYDLYGRRIEADVNALPAGIYVIDGVKVAIK